MCCSSTAAVGMRLCGIVQGRRCFCSSYLAAVVAAGENGLCAGSSFVALLCAYTSLVALLFASGSLVALQ